MFVGGRGEGIWVGERVPINTIYKKSDFQSKQARKRKEKKKRKKKTS